MYYIIRAIIYIILALLFTFIIIKLRKKVQKKIQSNSINQEQLKKYSKFRYKLMFCILCSLVIIFIIDAVKFPVEQYFLTFNSEADAFYYYLIDNSNFDRYEKENSIFYVDKKNKIYGLTKSNDKFSYLNYKNFDVNYEKNFSMKDFEFSGVNFNLVNSSITAKYNETNNITFYYLTIGRFNENDNIQVNINGKHTKLINTKDSVLPTTKIEYKKYYYTYFSEGVPYENIEIETDNKVLSFVKTD